MSRSASELVASDGLVASLPGWRLVRVRGADRIRFLHSQLTSDVRALGNGGAQPTAFLDRSGRLRAWGLLQRREHEVWMLAESAPAEVLAEGLSASVIADEVEIAVEAARPLTLALGPLALAAATSLDPERTMAVVGWGSRGVVTWDPTPVPGEALDDSELALLHVVAGPPRWQREARPGQLVNETTLVADAVSFSKGCYLGQETVSKVATRRGAATTPWLLEVEDGFDVLEPGTSFEAGGHRRAGVVRTKVVDGRRRIAHAGLSRELQLAGRRVEGRLESGAGFTATVLGPAHLPAPTVDDLAERLYHLAAARFAADREDEAAQLLRRVIELHPRLADAYEALGVLLGRHGRYEEAIGLMNRLLEVDPTSVMAHSNLSLYHNRLGRIAEAEEEARLAALAAVELRRGDREREEAERLARETAEADRRRRQELFRQVLAIDPDDATANLGLGELAVEAGDYATAAAHLDRTLAVDPHYSVAYLALGRAHEGLGDLPRARETYQRGIEVALGRGDLQPASRMQERLRALSDPPLASE